MKTRSLLCTVALTLLLCLAPFFLSAQEQSAQFDASAEREMVDLINRSRAAEQLSPLVIDTRLTRAARKHTLRMLEHKELSHQYNDEESLPLRYANENIRAAKTGENIALEPDVAMAHQALMESPGHRANILNPDYNAVGVGIVNTGHEVYVTEDFAQRTPDYSEHEADAALQHTIERYAVQMRVPKPVRKPQPSLHDVACQLALNDSLDGGSRAANPGVRDMLEWTANDLDHLPGKAEGLLAQPGASYSMGICFAPSVSHPGGVYWIVMLWY